MKVVIAAAGTAGHINPGLAIAKKYKRSKKIPKSFLLVQQEVWKMI